MFERSKGPKTPEDMVLAANKMCVESGTEQSFEHAVALYKKAAAKRYLEAMYRLGYMYECGHGVKQSYKDAFKWYEKAADYGYTPAYCALGFLYEAGLGTKRSRDLAVECYDRAAKADNARAQNNLGLIYLDKEFHRRSDHAAMTYFQKGNLQEFPPSQANLAMMYQKGIKVDRSCKVACTIYKKSAKNGNIFAKRALGNLYHYGLGVEQSETISKHLYLEAARFGDPYSVSELAGEEYPDEAYTYNPGKSETPHEQMLLGLRYLDGTVTGQSTASAVYWLENASRAGNLTAMYILGFIHQVGYCMDASIPLAVKWFKWGADKGNGACAYALAALYEERLRGEVSEETVFNLYKKASASDGDEDIIADSFYAMGLHQRKGKGVQKSESDALASFVKSADMGHSAAQYMAGTMYLKGIGTEVSMDLARKYLRMAADQGDGDAEDLLESAEF
ncbi:MAG: sel1 repeat family protein [archaeon]|nr:sel1 repeat family protein [archaeon]